MRKWTLAAIGSVLATGLSFNLAAADFPADFGAADSIKRTKETTPLERYHSSVELAALYCGMAFTLAQAASKSDAPSADTVAMADYRKCISLHKSAIKTNYGVAQRSAKTGAARAALKEHLVQALASLDGIEPGSNELKIHYERRQDENAVKRKEAWTRFEIE